MGRLRVVPAPGAQVDHLTALLHAHPWEITSRKYIAEPDEIQFRKTIWPRMSVYEHVRAMIPAEYQFHAVRINKYDPVLWPTPKRHRDSKNEGLSLMIVLGAFQGGFFQIELDGPKNPPTTVAQMRTWIVFDGSFFHWAEATTKGIRYSVIAFNLKDHLSRGPTQR